jgi:adenylate cyclase
MDRIWQWAWGRYGARYSWAVYAIMSFLTLPIFLIPSFGVVAFERSGLYVEAAALTAVAVLMLGYAVHLPSVKRARLWEQWAAGHPVDSAMALEATYTWGRGSVVRALAASAVWGALLLVAVGAIVGASGSRLVQYGIVGAAFATAAALIPVHSMVEAQLRPVRLALASDTGIGDVLPRSRPSFAAWSNVLLLATAFAFTVGGAMLATVFHQASEAPVLWAVLGCGATLFVAVPITVAAAFSPSMQPIRDLAEGTERVAAGDYSQRLPVVQDDDLGALAASFNRMQAGLAERQRLQGAFGTYVDPALAARLLEQGDDVFTGERREVSTPNT